MTPTPGDLPPCTGGERPALRTILRITNPSGRLVDFSMQGDNGPVSAMLVAGTETDARAVPSCD
jgi:hypothetical protein